MTNDQRKTTNDKTVYDLIIIGAGPAGITAAVYAARKKMNFLVITRDVGGQTAGHIGAAFALQLRGEICREPVARLRAEGVKRLRSEISHVNRPVT